MQGYQRASSDLMDGVILAKLNPRRGYKLRAINSVDANLNFARGTEKGTVIVKALEKLYE